MGEAKRRKDVGIDWRQAGDRAMPGPCGDCGTVVDTKVSMAVVFVNRCNGCGHIVANMAMNSQGCDLEAVFQALFLLSESLFEKLHGEDSKAEGVAGVRDS